MKNQIFRRFRSIARFNDLLILILIASVQNDMVDINPSPSSTKMIFEIIRHGSRSAENSEIKLGWSDDIGALPSELTVYGQRMQYYLGVNTRLRYPSIFSENMTSLDFWVRSTDYNRTLASAIAHLSGITNIFSGQQLKNNWDSQLFLPPQKLIFGENEIEFSKKLTTALPFGLNSDFISHSNGPIDTQILTFFCPNLK